MTEQQKNTVTTVVKNIKGYLLDGPDVKRKFAENEIQKIFMENQELAQRDIISYLHLSQLTGANPALKQIYLVSHFDKRQGRKVGTPIFSYHFLLAKAKEAGTFNGVNVTTEVEDVFDPIKGDMKKELVSTAVVEVNGFKSQFKAHWSEFYNPINHIWKSKPYIMLEKCAIANVLKRAFPEALSGMMIREEYNPQEPIEAEYTQQVATDILNQENDQIKIEVKPHDNKRNANKSVKFTLDSTHNNKNDAVQ